MTAGFVAMQKQAIREYAGIPNCTAIRDFLTHCQKEKISELSLAQKKVLRAHLEGVFDVLRAHSAKLLLQFGADEESQLSAGAWTQYQKEMKEKAAELDHYP